MSKKPSEKEIDDLVIVQADNEDNWTIENLKKKAERGSRVKFLQALSKVPKATPDEEDKIE